MPNGLLVIVPLPVPALLTVSKNPVLNEAVTVWLTVIVTVQVGEVPAHAPDHPTNSEPATGAAVSVTGVFVT